MTPRRKKSLLEDLIAVSTKIPLWANIFASLIIYVALHHYGGSEAPWITKANTPHDLAELGQFAAGQILNSICFLGQFILPPIFLLGGLIGAIKRKINSKKFNLISTAQDPGASIRNLTWQEFERMTGEAFRRQGYAVKETKKGPDGGIDLVLNFQGELFFVQCKQWRALKVSVQIVRELYGVMASQGAAGGFVVTSGQFTAEAKKFSAGTNVQLIDGEKLTQWFTKLPAQK